VPQTILTDNSSPSRSTTSPSVMQMFPLPPKPKGVTAPEFLNVLKNEELRSGYSTDDASTASESEVSLTSTGRPSRGARKKSVDYSELNIDDDGNDASSNTSSSFNGTSASNGRKRKQSTKKATSKRGSKTNKKSRNSTSTASTSMLTDSDEESDFTVDLSDDDDESTFKNSDDDTLGSDKEGDVEHVSSRKKSRANNSIPWNEIPLEQGE